MLKDYIHGLPKKWPQYGRTIMCDGWTTKTRRPLINFMVYSNRNMIFHKSMDTTRYKKTKEYIFKHMDKVIDEIRESHVVQIVTANEASFKAAGKMLMNKREYLY